MLRLEDLESRIIGSVGKVVSKGFLLISGDHGLAWNVHLGQWESDSRYLVPVCDVLGSVLLTYKLNTTEHRGQYERAIRIALDPDFYTLETDPDLDTLLDSEVYQLTQSLLNGWDGLACAGGHEAAYFLGLKLSRVYKPLSVDLLEIGALTNPACKEEVFAEIDESELAEDTEQLQQDSDLELVEFTELECSSTR